MTRSSFFFLTLSLAGGQAVAQPTTPAAPKAQEEKAKAEPGWNRRVFEIKHADVRRLEGLIRPFGVAVTSDMGLKAITVAAPPDAMSAIEELVKRLDVPQPPAKNVELIVYLMFATTEASAEGSPLSSELEAVVTQLKGLFNYKGFRVLDTTLLRVRDGQGGQANGSLRDVPSANGSYQLQIRNVAVNTAEPTKVIRIDGLKLHASPSRDQETRIETDIDVREGQKVVVGKANMDNSGSALILVVTARVV